MYFIKKPKNRKIKLIIFKGIGRFLYTTGSLTKSFENYLVGEEYDRAEGLLLSIVRKAFQAGWDAAAAHISGAKPDPDET